MRANFQAQAFEPSWVPVPALEVTYLCNQINCNGELVMKLGYLSSLPRSFLSDCYVGTARGGGGGKVHQSMERSTLNIAGLVGSGADFWEEHLSQLC